MGEVGERMKKELPLTSTFATARVTSTSGRLPATRHALPLVAGEEQALQAVCLLEFGEAEHDGGVGLDSGGAVVEHVAHHRAAGVLRLHQLVDAPPFAASNICRQGIWCRDDSDER